MRVLRLVPLVSLGVVIGVLSVAFLSDPPLDFPFSEPPEGAPIPSVELTLGAHALEGSVVDDAGEPVEGAGVTIKDGARPAWTWTDANGTFVLDGLVAGPKRALVTARGFQSTGFDVEVDPSRIEPITLTLDRRIGAPPDPPGLRLRGLVGKVEFGPLAAPQEGYELLLLPTTEPSELEGGFPRRTPVEVDGSFEVRLLHEGDYRAILLAPDDRGANTPDLLGDDESGGMTFLHRVDGEASGLTLVSTAGGIRGTVLGPVPRSSATDAAAQRVVRGALVRAERYVDARDRADGKGEQSAPGGPTVTIVQNEFRATRTDADGRYLLRDLPPGRYRVTVVAGRSRRQSDVIVTARTAVDIDFETTR